MKILCFDTTTRDLVVGLYEEREGTPRISGETVPDCLKGHSEILLPTVDRLLEGAGLKLSDIDAFAACAGPGSFTGIRIGLVTMRTFCQVTGKPGIPVNSLEYRAYHVPCQNEKCVCLDAMQNKVYYALYEGEREISAPAWCEKAELKDRIPAGAKVFSDTPLDIPFEGYGELHVRLAQFAYDRREHAQGYEGIQPLYLRKCQAEEQLAEKRDA